MKFPYRKIALPQYSDFFGRSILRPIIPVEVSVNGKKIRYAALIDSGADFCIFDGEIGEFLGLEIEKGPLLTFGGIQGMSVLKAYIHEVVLDVGGLSYKTNVGFSRDISQNGVGILGQKGFFDVFSVKFEYSSEDIEIKEKRIIKNI